MRKITSCIALILVCVISIMALVACNASITGIELKKGTLSDTVEQGATYDTSTAVILVTYSDGTEVEVSAEQLTFGTISTNSTGTVSLTISYEGFSITHNITVTAVATDLSEVVSSIAVTAGSLPTKVAKDGTVDTSNAVVTATMGDGTTKVVDNDDVTFSTVDTSTVGTTELTITYQGVSCKHSIEVVEDGTGLDAIATLEVQVGTLATSVVLDGTLDTSKLVLVATYGNGMVQYITEDIVVSALDSSDYGSEQTITITYDSTTIEHKVTIVAGDIDVSKTVDFVTVVTGSIASSVVQDGTLSTSSLQLVVTYLDGTTETVSSGFVVGTIDTSVLGDTKVTITYTDTLYNVVTVDHSYTVVTQASTIMLESLTSALIEDFDSNSTDTGDTTGFVATSAGETAVMYAGDDSSYHLRVYASTSGTTGVLNYELKDIIKTITITSDTVLDDDMADYVTVDYTSGTFDFDESAIGHTFTITIAVGENNIASSASASDCTVTATVTVIDGYNIYESYELSLYDNVNSFGGDGAGIWTEFKTYYFGENWATEYVFDNFVLQADIVVDSNSLASGFFWTTSSANYSTATSLTNQTVEGSLMDMGNTGIYNRTVDNDDEVTIEGNCFTIDASSLALMVVDRNVTSGVEYEVEGDTVISSNAIQPMLSLFLNQYAEDNDDKSGASVTWSNVAFYGNGANDGKATTSGAVTLCKNTTVSFTATNNIVKNFYTAYLFNREGSDDNVYGNAGIYSTTDANIEVYVLDQCKLLDSYNTMVYATGTSNIMIIDSTLDGAGGPAIIGASLTPNVTGTELQFGTNVNVINSTVSSLVNGSEPWFADYGLTNQVSAVTTLVTPYFDGTNGNGIPDTSYGIAKTISAASSTTYMNIKFVLIDSSNKGTGGYDTMEGSYMEFADMDAYYAYVTAGCANGTDGNYGLCFNDHSDKESAYYMGSYAGSFFQANNGASALTVPSGSYYWGDGVDFISLYVEDYGLGVVLEVFDL